MTEHKPHQIIPPSNMLRAKIGTDPALLHKQAVERANQALDGLKSEFIQWIGEDLDKLKKARDVVREDPSCAQSLENLRTHSHDLKGLGTTYGFPLVSRLAGSLCKLIEGIEARSGALPMDLAEKHIDAMIAVVAQEIKTDDDTASVAVAETLELMAAQHIASL